MKNLKSILVAMLVVVSVSMLSCKDTNAEATEKQGKEYTSAYVCPMHCKESGSDKEGACDTCGMALVKNEDHKSNGHKHE